VKLCAVSSVLVFSIGTSAGAQESKPLANCAGLTVMLRSDIDRMRILQERAKKEGKAPPPDLLSAWQRTFGKKDEGMRSLKELQNLRQRADGLNESLREKGCAPMDIDRALGTGGSETKGR
jgi:hypothetical protein